MSSYDMTAWDFLKELNKTCQFMSRERTGRASNSELKRWIQNKCLSIDGNRVQFDEIITFPLDDVWLFPRKRVSLGHFS